MPNPVRWKLITDAVIVRAQTLANVTVYRVEVNTEPPKIPNDPEGRVARYITIQPLLRGLGPNPDLGDTAVDLTYGFQATCVAGYAADCEYLVDQVDALLYRWIPAVAGLVFGAFRPPAGYQPGPVRQDNDVRPPRFWVPLQYQIVATAS